MKNGKWLPVVFVASLVLVISLIVYYNSNRYSWVETYDVESREPYGTYVLGELLKNYISGKEFKMVKTPVIDVLNEVADEGNSIYFFAGSYLPYDTNLTSAILDFVARGNTAFIAATYCPDLILDKVFPDTCLPGGAIYSTYDEMVVYADLSGFDAQSVPIRYVFKNEPAYRDWAYLDSAFFCGFNEAAEPLGKLDGYFWNFVSMPYDEGKVFLYTTPLALTNYALKNEKNVKYLSGILSHLPEQNIIWDEYSRYQPDNGSSPGPGLSYSPLAFVLSQPALRWAWYIALALLCLLLIFYGKRRQRIIPVLEEKANTSMQYIAAIGELYYQNSDHRKICLMKMQQFLVYVQQNYSINANNADEAVIKKLSNRSLVPYDETKAIFIQFRWINDAINISDELLIEFNNIINNFYTKCK